ncbi:MAG: hypothetical protein V4555_11640 [Acidobacteriota bacterium]
MLDVHPPHEASHTWRDFFIHIATICVGLLIAIGLEQSVEALHRHHEHHQLQDALNRESRQILFDTTRVEAGETLQIQWLRQAETQISDAARDHHPLAPLAPNPRFSWDLPDEPVYKAARASAKLDLLSDDETVVYGELDAVMTQIADKYKDQIAAQRRLDAFARELNFALPAGAKPLASASPADLTELHTRRGEDEAATVQMRYWSRQARGAVTGLLAGQRDLHQIETAERQFDNIP